MDAEKIIESLDCTIKNFQKIQDDLENDHIRSASFRCDEATQFMVDLKNYIECENVKKDGENGLENQKNNV